MKTAVVLKRDLSGFSVRQNSKTGMLNANDLVEIYNELNPKTPKRIDNYLRTNETQEYIDVVCAELNREEVNTSDLRELEFNLESNTRPDNVIKTSRGRVNGGTWMHPYLFIDFAMWLSPEFKLKCVKWLNDKLLKFRNDAGDSFKEVNLAIKLNGGEQRQIVYIREARMINELVFGNPKGKQRNSATEEQLSLLTQVQRADIKLIEKGQSFESRKRNLETLVELLDS